mmetsp:Transcript_13972/g.25270  ORF Transcript_13972/g.25270 Transcript_13972/m.25270 type:complete len:322 (+) Transcript_13972:887-1852(+)
MGAEVQGLGLGFISALALAVLEVRQVEGHVVAEVGGDDGGRGLAGAQSEVVPRTGDGHAHQISVLVHGGDDGRHDHREGGGVARGLVDLGGVKHHDPVLGGETPVIVFSRSVDIVEGFLLQKRRESVTRRHLLDDLHHHDVLIYLGGVVSVQRCEFVLAGCHLAMARLERDADAPALVLHLLHAGQCGIGQRGRGHVVIAHLLSPGCVPPDDGASRHLQIGTTVVLIARDQEEFLLEADVGDDVAVSNVESEVGHETLSVLGDGGVGSEEGSLLVERRAVVTDEGAGDEDGVAPEEDGGAGVEGEVSAGRVGGAKASVGVG